MAFLSTEELEETPEFRIMSRLSQPNASPTVAAHETIKLTREILLSTTSEDRGKLGDHLDQTFTSLIHIAGRTAASEQSALVEVIQILRQQEVSDPETGEPLRSGYWSRIVWTELPGLNVAVREDYSSFSPLSDPTFEPTERNAYVNKMAYLARMTGTPENLSRPPEDENYPYDWSSYALASFSDAFEQVRDIRPTNDWCLREICYWLIYAADVLWKNVQERLYHNLRSGGSSALTEDPAYHGRKARWFGYNRERWDMWIRGVRACINHEDEQLRDLVAKALAEVARVEDQSWRITEEERYA